MLTDFNLASWTKDLGKDYTRTSQQRTETPPCMAHGLLDGSDDRHLYRHDPESLFYIMLIVATHYEIQLGNCVRDGDVKNYPIKCGSVNRHAGVLLIISKPYFQTGNVSTFLQPSRTRHWLGDLRMSSDEKSMPKRSIRMNL